MNTTSRLSFLKSAGAAAGVAVIAASPVAAATEPGQAEIDPSVPIPREAVVAIVRDAGRGEITILAGETEKTYRDRLLVKRLMKAAHRQGVA